MLQLTIPERELYNDSLNEFIQIPSTTLELEHSLISLSKWESKWKKPFLNTTNRTGEEMRDYIKCMILSKNYDPVALYGLTNQNMQDIQDYIANPMTATTIKSQASKPSREIITSEIIYYWMIEFGIPFECQKWHLNRLMMLIQVCGIKQSPSKKMKKNDILADNHRLNAARRAAMHTRG